MTRVFLVETFQNDFIPDLKVTLWEIEDIEDEMPMYSLKWEYRNCYYEFLGKNRKKGNGEYSREYYVLAI